MTSFQFLQQEDPVLDRPATAERSCRLYQECGTHHVPRTAAIGERKFPGQVTWVKGSGESRQVDVAISASDEGKPYSLKEIRLTGATVFPSAQLLALIAIHPGELMSRTQFERGLDAMRELYATRGYIAFAAIPRVEFEDDKHLVRMEITVQEDSPFHFGNLSTEGLDRATSQELQQAWARMGKQFYSPEKLSSLLHRSLALPDGVDPLDYSSSNFNFDTHTVDVKISAPPPTPAENAER